MSTSKNKSNILLQVIEKLQSREINYDWVNQDSDNVGVIACLVSGKDQDDFSDDIIKERIDLQIKLNRRQVDYDPYDLNFWEPFGRLLKSLNKKNLFKPTSIFYKLEESGFTLEELDHIQYLNNKDILKSTSIVKDKDYHNKKENLIEYLRSWIFILNREYAEVA